VVPIQGFWLFIALASLSGFSITLPVHWGAAFFFHLVWIRIFKTRNRKLLLRVSIVYILSILAGLWCHTIHLTHLKGSETSFHIRFQNAPSFDGNLIKSIVSLPEKRERLILQYTIPSQSEKSDLERTFIPGTECMASGELIEPEKNRNENLFNYKFYLEEENIHWILKAGSFDSCRHEKAGIIEKIEAGREKGMEQIRKMFSPSAVPYAEALLFGDSSSFDDQQYAMFQRLGVVHLLAISGLQVNILAMGLFFILIRMGFTREFSKKLLLFILPIYAIICGSNAPVVRAVFMSMLLLAGSKKNLLSGIDALSISFLICMFYNPFILFNIGFQLSFSVSLSILLSSRTILARQNNAFVKMLIVSIVSQVVSLPILMYSFFQVSIISLITNLIFVPFYSFLLTPLILIDFVISFLSNIKGMSFILHPLFYLFSKLLDLVIMAQEKIAERLDGKWSVFITGKPGILFVLLLFTGIFFFYICWEKGNKLKACLPLLVLMTLFILFQTFSPFGEVTYIDIGQGDSILIKLPFNRGTYLIDTGGEVTFEQEKWKKRLHEFHVGKDILIPYLKSKGIRKIDKLILTHSDQDHIGAARELVREIAVQTLYISPNAWRKPLMSQTLKVSAEEHIPVQRVKAGYSWKNASGFFTMVSPLSDVYEGNNSSIVLYASFGGETWLFTGDLEKEGEERLMKAYHFQANILKVGHHGSKTATSDKFIEQLTPKIAVISVGKHNRFGHPHQEVLDTLQSHHVIILRTDQDGAVHYRFFRNRGTFSTDLP
jgi:competence protein ComEC